ncbi:MAG: MBL fold metallo-hydrolase [Thermomicrobiales bacterium]|nr:MBL fold metallo-hydrolase [Thermomicrobiales bacterium]
MAEIKWFGHNCFRIRAKEATVITDPVDKVTGYSMSKQTADIVLVSHPHKGHSNLNAVKPEYQLVDGPGEYEMHGVFITGVRTYHDAERGAERGYNTIFIFELDGMKFCHLGDLGHLLTSDQLEEIGTPDVLMVPAGGKGVITPSQAAEVIGQLEPKIIIPMQYATEQGDRDLGDLASFCKALGVETPVAEEKLTLRDAGEATQVIALIPES